MADTRYYRIAPKIWRHAMLHRWTTETTLLAIYLLTSPHRNAAGLYVMPRSYMLADLGYPEDVLDNALDTLIAEDVVRYDTAAQVVLLVKGLAYDAPENPNQRKGAIKYLAEVPDTPLWADLLALADRYAPTLAQDIRELMAQQYPERLAEPLPEPLPEPFAQPLPEPVRNTVSVSVTVSESESEKTDHDDHARVRTLEQGWFNAMGATLNKVQLDALDDYLDDPVHPLPLDVVCDAMNTAAEWGHRKDWGYFIGILDKRRDQGLITLALVREADAQRKTRKASRASPAPPTPVSFAEMKARGDLP